DGRVVEGPTDSVDPGNVYQLVIDNAAEKINGRSAPAPMVLDLRVTVVGRELSGAFRKYRLASERFLNTAERVFFHKPGELFSDAAQPTLLAFAAGTGRDLAGFAVMRDPASWRIYAIDANGSPPRPP